jgi:hypothetical protein
MSLEQFGQTIKAKHPEYGDLSDADVATKVLAKYPQYKDMVQSAPQAAPDSRNFIQKGVDALTTVTPEQRAGHGAIVNAMQDFGAGAIQGLTAPIVHPIQTIEGIGKVGSALLGDKESADQIVNGIKQEGVAKNLGNLVGGAIFGEGAGEAAAPIARVAGKGLKRAVLLGKTPEGAYESALKPSTTLSPEERAAVVKTGLEQAIPISKGGLEKLGGRIEALNQAIKDEIAADPTRPIDPNKVATRADVAKAKFANQVNAQGDLNAIEASKQQFLDEQGRTPGAPAQPTGLVDAQGNPIMKPAQPPKPAPPMNAADAQTMKQGTYRVLKGKFGEQGSASVEAQKALARGLKEEIASQFPEINGLNAAESKLLDLQPILERAVNRISNHQAIGIGTPVAGAAAKAVTGSGAVSVVASVLKGVLDNPSVKSRLAIAISKSSKIPISQAISRVQNYSSALGASAAGPIAADSQAYPTADSPNLPTMSQP